MEASDFEWCNCKWSAVTVVVIAASFVACDATAVARTWPLALGWAFEFDMDRCVHTFVPKRSIVDAGSLVAAAATAAGRT